MKDLPSRRPLFTALLALSLLATNGFAAGPKGSMTKPDFTQGDAIPAGASHDWTLGATGMRGWIYSNRLETSEARQIAVTKVDKGSPAAGLIQVGDVILGVAGKPFSFDPRIELGRALTAAETESGDGKLALTIWRGGKENEVVVKLPVLGSYSATAPYDCPKSARILKQGCDNLAKRIKEPNYRQNPITRSLNALALLASGDPQYLPIVKKEAEWAAGYSTESMATWYYGYVIMLLAEYQMATGDDSFMPGLTRLALEASEGQSMVGSWGHKFAGPDDRLVGYGMMNAPGLPLTTSLVLARDAGVKDPIVDLAIERSARLLRFYRGKGAVPYGDHSPWLQTHEDNGKCGMASVLFNQLGEKEEAVFFSKMSLASHGSERDTGHTGNFWNVLWSLPAVAQSGPNASGAWMQEFGAWYFDLARRWDGSFTHQGPPQMGSDSTNKWDSTGAYLLGYAMPLKKIHLTGKQAGVIPQLSSEEAKQVIMDGRGWSNNDRNSAYDALSTELVFDALDSWSPIVRQRAAMALSRRKDIPLPALISMLKSPELEARYGATEALSMLKNRAAPAISGLRMNLEHEDLWLRIESAEALASIGQDAMVALPKLLEMIAEGPTEDDPRNMQQRYLCFAVFGKMLKKSIEGVDRDALRKAVVAGLQNQDGRARGTIGSVYQHLSYDEIKPLLPAIQEAIVTPSPSGIMFAAGIRLAGLEILAKHRIKEGIPLCLQVMEIDKWGKQARIKSCLNALAKYGGAAKPILPELHQLEKDLLAHGEAKNLLPLIAQLRNITKAIERSTDTVELRSLN